MSSQGQRFRRRALRRGYKVDEVDGFLDRVEATLSGQPTPRPVSAQEVHDIVFAVRFGGYDEWQVDLHLDRLERQLLELEESGRYPGQRPSGTVPGSTAPGMGAAGMGAPGAGARSPLPERVPLAERASMGRATSPDPAMSRDGRTMPRDDRMMPRDDRMMPRDDRMMSRDDRMMPRDDRMMSRDDRSAPPMGSAAPPPHMTPPSPLGPPPAAPPGRAAGPVPPGTGRAPTSGAPLPSRSPGYDPYGPTGAYPTSFNGFEAGRRARAEMTSEIRMSEPAGPSLAAPAEVQRIDHMRRAFLPRRFGSGYDPGQVDQLFEGIVAALTGRSGVPIRESELNSSQFSLVPGGYFEAEVDAALKEVRDLLRRR